MSRIIKYITIHFRLTNLLLGLNIILFILSLILSNTLGGNLNYALLFMGADYTPFVLNGEVWRMITSSFLQGGILHLFLNMYALLIVAGFIEKFFGRRKLLTIYVFSALFGSIASLLGNVFEFWSNGGVGVIQSISVGASGAIFGMVGVLLGNRAKRSIYEPQLGVDSQQLVSIVVYNMLIGIVVNLIGGGSYINIWAHFGGLIGGFILGLLVSSINSFYIPRWRKILEKILFVLAVVILAGSFIAQLIFIISNLY